MEDQNKLTGSELLQLAQDRGVMIGDTYLINEQTYRLCATEEGSVFTHQIKNKISLNNLQAVPT